MSELRGRVTDVWSSGQAQGVAVLAGSEQQVVEVQRGERPLLPGDIVTLSLSAEGASVREVHARPGDAWDPAGDATRWRRPGTTPCRMELLRRRQVVLRELREHLFAEGFLEVQAPLLVRGTCPDVHIASVRAGDRYLTTSTEYQIKRMVVGGFEKVFTLTQNFREGDVGDHHNPEFTMLEWARAFASLPDIERDAEALVKRAFSALYPGRDALVYRGREVLVNGPWERITVAQALERHLGVRSASGASLRAEALRLGLDVPGAILEDDHALVSYLIGRAQPHLGAPAPVFLCDWPSFMTSSAGSTERSELVIAGLELSDGFPSVRDSGLQERLLRQEVERRVREGKDAVAIDERYPAALQQGIPPGAGMALGVDRLVMVLTGAEQIRDVLAFAWDEL